MDTILVLGAIFVAITLISFYIAYLYGRKTKRFRWREYIAIVIWPIVAVAGFAYFIDTKVLSLFVTSAVFGFVLEYILGLTYHKALNKRLWSYDRLSVGGYTSLLTLPIWGIAGVVFWFLSKMVGL